MKSVASANSPINPPPLSLDKMPHPSHKKSPSFARNYKTKAPPIKAPAMTMTAERSGSCSTAVALLDLVEEEGVAELVSEALALADEEVDTGNCGSVKQFINVNSERG